MPRFLGMVMLAGILSAGLAHAQDAPPSSGASDSQLRALSGSDAFGSGDPFGLHGLSRPERERDPRSNSAATPLVRPDAVDAAGLSKALAAGNKTSRQLTTPEEDDAGSIGGALLAIAGLVLAVVVIARFNSMKNG